MKGIAAVQTSRFRTARFGLAIKAMGRRAPIGYREFVNDAQKALSLRFDGWTAERSASTSTRVKEPSP